ncbi:MAG TPA: hypothetical protein VGY55_20415 [Pirellulales bacterium]|nr:hypothetical protein [Pirellulales bacterium]
MNRNHFHRFQFHLRTLLIVVTLLTIPCAYIGAQAEIVRERKAMLENGHLTLSEATPARNRLPRLRVWLGDVDCFILYFDPIVSDSDLERYRVAFPEAQVTRFTDGRMIRR